MPKTIIVRITLTDAEIALFRQYAAENYKSDLGIDWRCVAQARAVSGVKDAIAKMQERQVDQTH